MIAFGIRPYALFYYILFGFSLLSCRPQNPLAVEHRLSFWDYELREQLATVKGRLDNYSLQDDEIPLGRLIYNDLLSNDQINHQFTISDSGTFQISFPLLRPQEVWLALPGVSTRVYAAPSRVTDLVVDQEASRSIGQEPPEKKLLMAEPITFNGDLAHVNNPWTALQPALYHIHSYVMDEQPRHTLSPAYYKKWRMDRMERQLDTLRHFIERYQPHSDFMAIADYYIRYHAFEDLIRYTWLRPENKGRVDTLVPVDAAYLDFLRPEYLNDRGALITEKFSDFIRESRILFGYRPEITLEQTYDYLRREAKLEAEEKRWWEKAVAWERSVQKDSLAAIDPQLRTLKRKHNDMLQPWRSNLYFEGQLQRLLDTLPPGLGRDVSVARFLLLRLESWKQEIAPEKLQGYLQQIESPDIKAQVLAKQEALEEMDEVALPEQAHIIPEIDKKAEQAYQDLLKQFKGQVVYLDFWAPWCAPCMAEMPASKALQAELADRPVAFVYYAVNCSKESWERTIKKHELGGYHYHSDGDEYAYLAEKFNISGIPRYVLIDREGRVVDENAPRPSQQESVLAAIERLLE